MERRKRRLSTVANLLMPEMVSNSYTVVCFNRVTPFRLTKKRSSSPLPYRKHLQLHPFAQHRLITSQMKCARKLPVRSLADRIGGRGFYSLLIKGIWVLARCRPESATTHVSSSEETCPIS